MVKGECMLKKLTRYSLFVILAILLALPVWAQRGQRRTPQDLGKPAFHLNAVSLLSETPGKTKVVFYVEIAYSNLRFIRSARGFEANYEVDLSLLVGSDEESSRYANKLWRSTVITDDFEKTTSPEYVDVSETTLELPPAEYGVIATVTDLETKRQETFKSRIELPGYGQGSLEISDLLLARDIRVSPGGQYQIVPNVDRQIMDNMNPLHVYYEIYPAVAESLLVYSRIMDESGSVVADRRHNLEATQPITRDTLAFDLSEQPVGRYILEVQVSGGNQTALKGSEFRIRMSGLPGTVQDIETAIRQLRYIARTGELKRMLEVPPEMRQQMFMDFWDTRDPTPETPENELMEEYYDRIARTNALFGGFRDGWETDRGEVYIRFGPPSEIERHPYEIDSKPYQIWYYYDTQRRYIFVDELGYGDYRLVSNLWQ